MLRPKLLFGLLLVAALYLAAMFVGTHIPYTVTPQDDPYSLDKLLHTAAFATLAVLLCIAGSAWLGVSWKLYAAVFTLIAAYGAFDEFTQSLVFSRDADQFDWLADLTGAALGITLFSLGRGLFLRRYQATSQR